MLMPRKSYMHSSSAVCLHFIAEPSGYNTSSLLPGVFVRVFPVDDVVSENRYSTRLVFIK
jgi:hypothetical protein